VSQGRRWVERAVLAELAKRSGSKARLTVRALADATGASVGATASVLGSLEESGIVSYPDCACCGQTLGPRVGGPSSRKRQRSASGAERRRA